MAVDFNGTRVTHVRSTATIAGYPAGTLFWQYGDGFIAEDKAQTFTKAQVLNALTSGDAEVYTFPDPTWVEGRLQIHNQFPNRRVLVIATPRVSIAQMQALVQRDEILFEHIVFNRRPADDLTTRIAIQVRIERDENGDVIVPNWVSNNYNPDRSGAITHILTWWQAKQAYQDASNAFLLDGSVALADITIQCSDGQVTGTQAYNYIRRLA